MNSFQALKSFTEAKLPFKVLYNTHQDFKFRSISRLCVLDSSFNPPHNAHEALAIESIKYDYTVKAKVDSMSTDQGKALLLLLSVKNADKIVPQPAIFQQRIDMMLLMANNLSSKLGINVSVGLTSHAMFVDKSQCINEYLQSNESCQNVKLTFLLGFDTLIRLFNNKYYEPVSAADALGRFMNSTDLFVLTRLDKTTLGTDDQFQYLLKIINGETDLPSSWGDKIYLVDGEDNNLEISSSDVRNKIQLGDNTWKQDVCNEVANYIELNNLYR